LSNQARFATPHASPAGKPDSGSYPAQTIRGCPMSKSNKYADPVKSTFLQEIECDQPFSRAAAEGSSTDLDQGERLARANALIEAALRCDWQDAEMVMSSLLEEFRAGPPLPALAEIEDDAAFWAK